MARIIAVVVVARRRIAGLAERSVERRHHRAQHAAIAAETAFRQPHLLDSLAGAAPMLALLGQVRAGDLVDEKDRVVLQPVAPVGGRRLPGMVAVIAEHMVDHRGHRPALQREALGEVRIDVPPQNHPLVEAVDREQIGA